MKNIKILTSIILILTFYAVQAQKIEYQGKKYKVKKDLILLNGEDITASLTESEQTTIKKALKQKIAIIKANANVVNAKRNLRYAKKKYRDYSMVYQKDLIATLIISDPEDIADDKFHLNNQHDKYANLKRRIERAERNLANAEAKYELIKN